MKSKNINLRVLIIDDSEDDTFLILRELRKGRYNVQFKRIDCKKDLIKELRPKKWDVVITDYSMPALKGIEVIHYVRDSKLDIPCIVISGVIGEETAVLAMHNGAHDYLMKNNLTRLVPAVEREIREYNIRCERKKVQMELEKHVLELARSNEELKQFAYVASHDLQEPLRMISSYTQLLKKRYYGHLDKNADEFMTFIVESVRHMKNLIEDLLAYSRLGFKQKNKLKLIDTNTAVKRALFNLKQLIFENKAKIVCNTLPKVKGDIYQITQLFQNLIGNAIKFRRKVIPNIKISCKKQNKKIIFEVTDNGIGIKKEFHNKIFSIFQRLHSKTKYPGTGIGLAVCKKIVENNGGKIWIKSIPNRGSTFYFTI